MKPLRITIELSTPMIEPEMPFHIDGLLGALRVAEAERLHGAINPRDWHHDLPLERYTSPGGDWVFKASAFTLKREEQSHLWMMTGRLDTSKAAERRASGLLHLRASKPNLAGGPFKGSLFCEPIVWTSLEGWCVGDKAGIEALLARCEKVGGRRGVGFGRVSSISVQEIEEPECRWYHRNLPADYDGPGRVGLVPVVDGLHPPYWDRRLHRPVLVPELL